MANITIIPLADEHFDDYVELEFDPEVKKYVGGVPKKTKESMKKQLENGEGKEIQAIVNSESNEFIGRCGFTIEDDETEIYLLIAKKYWPKKYGKRVIEMMLNNINQILVLAVKHPDNIKSIVRFESLGFQRAGTKSCESYQNNHLIFRYTKNA